MKLRLKNNSEFFDFDNLMAECTENDKINFKKLDQKICKKLPQIVAKIGDEIPKFENFSIEKKDEKIILQFDKNFSVTIAEKIITPKFENKTFDFEIFLQSFLKTKNKKLVKQILSAFNEILDLPEKNNKNIFGNLLGKISGKFPNFCKK